MLHPMSSENIVNKFNRKTGKVFEIIQDGVWVYNKEILTDTGQTLYVGDTFVLCDAFICKLDGYHGDDTIQLEILLGSQIRYILVDRGYFGLGFTCDFFKEMR